jgi:hypothetical protein
LIFLSFVFGLAVQPAQLAQAQEETPQTTVLAWQRTPVTQSKVFAQMGDRHMRLDSQGRGHLAYGGDHLYYAYYDGAVWQLETVDNGDGVGLYASLALDSANQPHISYYDAASGALKYARKVGGTWEKFVLDAPTMAAAFELADDAMPAAERLPALPVDVQPLDTSGESVDLAITMKGRGLFTSIAIDPYNEPHIAYYDADNGDLKYAHKVYSGWQITTIDSANDTGQYASIAVGKDANNKLFTHFSYYDATAKDLRYAKWSAESASIIQQTSVDGTADDDIGKYSSIALTNEGDPQPRISYYAAIGTTKSYLKYAAYKGSSWVKENVTADNQFNGKYASLALDNNNAPHIAYLNASSNRLKLAIPDSNGWSNTEIATVDGNGMVFTSIDVDTNVANAHSDARVSFYHSDNGAMQFATQVSSESWIVASVDSSAADLGAFNALAFDSAGNPHISFFDDTHDDLLYVYWNGSAWVGPGAVDVTGSTGIYNDIAIGADGKVHIAYYSVSTTCLRYATWVSDHWMAENVEVANSNGICPSVGKFASIAVDPQNRPHIAYYDDANGALKWAYKDAGLWKIQTVDNGEDSGKDKVGLYTSIAVDASGQPHISYYDETNNRLAYAGWQNASAKFRLERQVDTRGGLYSQLALDAQGRPHIVYLDDYNEDVPKYAYKADNASTIWGFEIIDPKTNLLTNPRPPLVPFSIAIDAANTVHVSYYNPHSGDLQYARRANGPWTLSIVDNQGNVGQYASIGVNPAGILGISYYDATNGDLKYAKGQFFNLPYNIFLPVIRR